MGGVCEPNHVGCVNQILGAASINSGHLCSSLFTPRTAARFNVDEFSPSATPKLILIYLYIQNAESTCPFQAELIAVERKTSQEEGLADYLIFHRKQPRSAFKGQGPLHPTKEPLASESLSRHKCASLQRSLMLFGRPRLRGSPFVQVC